jgi:hypothetical protein
MFILHLLPDTVILWVCNGLLLVGIALTVLAFFIKSIPFINQYRIPAQILGIVLLISGVYFRGGYAVEQEWRERVAKVQAKVAAAEQLSKEETIKIVEKVVEKTKIVRTRGTDIIKYVDREVIKYDVKFAPGGVCEIPQEFITAYNRAAEVPSK